ncbi:MAG: methionyl-tRNA formyltransferase [Malacoplasma sp.]|nr:methionyl-tRNA formyltransferase [Malacoplasma sp.]
MGEERNCSQSKKIVFMGTPLIATYALNALIDANYDVAAVVCQPDKPIGRKKEIIYSPVKQLALAKNIPIFQPQKIIEIKQELVALQPFVFITCAFGQFLPNSILEIPQFGCVNVHTSLLPKYRGGAPVHWAIINGDKQTGVCLTKMVKKMDAGGVYCYKTVDILENETTSSLFCKMNNVVYDLVLNELPKVLENVYLPIPQNESEVSFAYNITKENEHIDFFQPSFHVKNLIKGLSDIPGGFCVWNNQTIKLFNCEILLNKSNCYPGTIVCISKNGIEIATLDFNILVKEIQFESKKRAFVSDLINGNLKIKINDILK